MQLIIIKKIIRLTALIEINAAPLVLPPEVHHWQTELV